MSTIKKLDAQVRSQKQEAKAERRARKNYAIMFLSQPALRGRRGFTGFPFRLKPKTIWVDSERVSGPDMPEEFRTKDGFYAADLYRAVEAPRTARYEPHQGAQEMARRASRISG